MKKIIVIILLIINAVVSQAGNSHNPINDFYIKSVDLKNTFNKIIIGENLNVILKNETGNGVSIEGTKAYLDNVNLVVSDGTLFIRSNTFLNKKTGTIYLSVGNLKQIQLENKASVTSSGFLNCKNLTVLVSEDSHASIRSFGQIKILPTNNCELDFERYQTITE